MVNIILDYGHGGLDTNGKYTTAPNKMHKFNEDDIIYEGVINRQIGSKVKSFLIERCYFVYETVGSNDPTDVSLRKRVQFINEFDKNKTIVISFHSNASKKHNARGFEIWTSKGETTSDIIATYIGEEIQDEFSNLKFRADYSDGDLDKEANFYILKNTKCPAVLLENLFFDQIDDAKLLRSHAFQMRLAWRITNGIIRYIKTIR